MLLYQGASLLLYLRQISHYKVKLRGHDISILEGEITWHQWLFYMPAYTLLIFCQSPLRGARSPCNVLKNLIGGISLAASRELVSLIVVDTVLQVDLLYV